MTLRLRSSGRWIFLAIIVCLMLGALYVEGRKAYWDNKVLAMCEKEGGIKVFRVVDLSSDTYKKLLNRRHQLELPHERFASADAKYVFSTTTEYLVRDGLEVRKYIDRVLERPGPTVLSESVAFSRIGGDVLAVDQPSAFSCPKHVKNLFDETFILRK